MRSNITSKNVNSANGVVHLSWFREDNKDILRSVVTGSSEDGLTLSTLTLTEINTNTEGEYK